jgi:2-polyprenyl-3-methyl-5-hydroxy-6-metoxy-1,4-benzoquinol methylase
MLRSLAVRRRQAELMDQPALGDDPHRHALRGLSRINWWSRSSRILWPALTALAQTDPQRLWRVLDLASGAGDVTCALGRQARRHRLRMEFLGCDVSPTAVAVARQTAAQQNLSASVAFESLDALLDPLPAGFDVVMCSLFLHHLEKDDAVRLLSKMGVAAECSVLVSDLRRTRRGYTLAWLGCRLLSRSPIVHFDGPVSVLGAFTGPEVLALANKAGLAEAEITYHWPQRYLLHWKRGVAP